MASERAIVLSDESDVEVEEVGTSNRQQQDSGRRSTGVQAIGPPPPRQRARRRSAINTPLALQTLIPRSSRRASRSQDSIVDLTSINDEDVIVIGSPEARKPAVKRKSSQSSLLLPDSPVGGPSAKCGICFQNMDEKMSCGPCGHVFCDACLRQAIKTQKRCPTCRRTLQLKQIHRIFLDP